MDSNPLSPPLSPTILTIAGSDPTGGAGIQADLKTMTTIGVYGAAAISCITVQNSSGVTEVVPIDTGLVLRQVQAVLTDHCVTHIKIGMVGSIEIAQALAELLTNFHGEVIYDPVLAATTGQSLLQSGNHKKREKQNVSEHLHSLIDRVTVLTPNGDELAQLSRQELKITTAQEAIACAQSLLHQHPHLQAVVIKGGHIEPACADIHDVFVLRNQEVITSKRARITSRNLHGTGCTYASAFAAFHCLHHDYRQAFLRTSAYMDNIIKKSRNIFLVKSGASGPLAHTLMETTETSDIG